MITLDEWQSIVNAVSNCSAQSVALATLLVEKGIFTIEEYEARVVRSQAVMDQTLATIMDEDDP